MIDYSVYPELDEIPTLSTDGDRADYVARICAAWDFGVVPTLGTFHVLAEWRSVFDQYPIVDSPAFAAFRHLFGWPAIAGGRLQRAHFEELDERGGVPADPFADRS